MNLLILKKLLSAAALATASAAAHPAPSPEPAYTTPMCDGHGRPLAGNVRTKGPQTMADCSVVTASR